jgi:putative membrane protein
VSAEPEPQDRARDGDVTDGGTDPDPRFTFANERTFLAWNRTSLALIAGGLAFAEILKGRGADIVAIIPIVLGAGLALGSYHRLRRDQRALRLGQPLPPSDLPQILAYGIVVLAVVAIVLAIVR